MPLIHMVLADHDYEYVNHLAQWFIENTRQFQISAFSEKESFGKFISENKSKINIILAAEDFLIDTGACNVIQVVLGQAAKLANLPAIEKYQPAPSICSNIMSVLSTNQAEAEKWYAAGKSELVVCFSMNTYLKSIFALLLSFLSSDYVYINLDSFPHCAIDEYYQAYNKNLSDILYHIKSQKGNPVMALESAVITGINRINFIPPLDNPGDLWELTGDETDIFIEALKSWGHFSKVIVDSECNLGPATIKLFEAASYIIIPFDKTNTHQVTRAKSMFNSITGLNPDKVRWVYCGSEEIFLSEELKNCHEIRWINTSIPILNGFALDSYKRSQIERIFSK